MRWAGCAGGNAVRMRDWWPQIGRHASHACWQRCLLVGVEHRVVVVFVDFYVVEYGQRIGREHGQ